MPLPFTHPSLARLTAFAADELDARARGHTARHLRECARCQDALRFVRSLDVAAAPAPPSPPEALRRRILASRAAGERIILPGQLTAPSRSAWRWRIATGAAVAALVLASLRIFGPSDALAVTERSDLTTSPAAPTRGSALQVRYRPGSMRFRGTTTLALRARLRTARDEAYSVPASQVRRLTTLRRDADGTFVGRVTLPDSIVFADLAVESLDSSRVDANDGHGWEVLVAESDGRPAFDALYQQANDMMGRSWERGYAAMRRATDLYPGQIEGWIYREFFERAIYTGATADSVTQAYRVRLDSLISSAKARPRLRYEEIGSVYFRTYAAAVRSGATRADSTEWTYWWNRIRTEYPRHEQVAQRLPYFMDAKLLGHRAALDSLESLYHALSPITGLGRALFNRAQQLMTDGDDPATVRRWLERAAAGSPDSARRMAMSLSARPAFRDEGMQLLRTLLRDSSARLVRVRALESNANEYDREVADQRRRMLASLGRALVVQGNRKAALDTLRLAASGTWDPALFAELAATYLQAGDTLAAYRMDARLVVDPRTSASHADTLAADGRRRLGAQAWTSALTSARREMHERLLERSVVRSVPESVTLRTRDGREARVHELAGGKPAVVIFWSRHCGPALEATADIATLIARLEAEGTRTLFVVNEAPSTDLDRALAGLKITWPVYFDSQGSLANAMNIFGTPSYYVLDGAGRVRFDYAAEVLDVAAQVEAVRSEGR